MKKKSNPNKGFSFIELLIAMTIFSIVMIMVVQFMSSTSGAFRKTKTNLNLQTEALQVTEQITDYIMQASFVRISTADKQSYQINYDKNKKKRTCSGITSTYDYSTFDLVPDNYYNYSLTNDPFDMKNDAIIDFSDYSIKNSEGEIQKAKNKKLKSFRILDNTTDVNNDASNDYYIKPEYVYLEYRDETDTLNAIDHSNQVVHVIFKIVDKNIYLYKYEKPIDKKDVGFDYACRMINSECVAKKEGIVTDCIEDLYISPHVDGNSMTLDVMFKNMNYIYNTHETVNFRNSNVLTVKPQKLYKVK